MPLSAVVGESRASAGLAWVVMAALVVAASACVATGDPLPAVFALAAAAVALLPVVASRDASAVPPWEVLAVALLPPLGRLADAPVPVEQAVSYLAVAALAFLVVVELHVFSSVELTPGVAVVLVVLLTTATVAVWAILQFAADAFLGTDYVEDKVRLMWGIVVATGTGVLAGPLAWAYLRRYGAVERRASDLSDGASVGAETGPREATPAEARSSDDARETPPTDESAGDAGAETSTDADRDGEGRALAAATRAMQVLLFCITLFGVVTLRWGLVINAGISLAVTFLPGLLERDLRLPMNPALTAWITLAVFLHAVGALGPYEWFGWYDSVTHTLSATVVAGAGYASARAVDLHYDRLTVPPAFMAAFVVVFVLAFGVVWEIMEFASGGLASLVGGEAVLAQYGARDIVLDLSFNAVGGVVVAAVGTSRLRTVARALAVRLASRQA